MWLQNECDTCALPQRIASSARIAENDLVVVHHHAIAAARCAYLCVAKVVPDLASPSASIAVCRIRVGTLVEISGDILPHLTKGSTPVVMGDVSITKCSAGVRRARRVVLQAAAASASNSDWTSMDISKVYPAWEPVIFHSL